MVQHLFPLGLAKAEAFFNRINERKRILENLKEGRHTLIVAPRRYGKTSLLEQVLEESGFLYEIVDLFAAVDEKILRQQIFAGVGNLIRKLSRQDHQVFTNLTQIMQQLNIPWMVTKNGLMGFELAPKEDEDPVKVLFDALRILDALAARKNQKIVYCIDELQEAFHLLHAKKIEESFVYLAKNFTHIRFVFSGTLNPKAHPSLAELCDVLSLQRISRQDYQYFINRLAKARWNQEWAPETFEKLFDLTECHAYYVNVICRRLWTLNVLPTAAEVFSVWQDYVREKKTEVAALFREFSDTQKKLLLHIAQGTNTQLTGKEMLYKMRVSSAGAVKALRGLEEKIILEKTREGQYFFMDALLRYSLQHFLMF